MKCKDSRWNSRYSLWTGSALAAPSNIGTQISKLQDRSPATNRTRSLMLTPLSLCGDQCHSLLLRMLSGSLLCAFHAKRSVLDTLDESRFGPADDHPEQVAL